MSNRAARRRAAKEDAKAAVTEPEIHLENPVQAHFASFVVGNAQYCDHVVEADTAKGQHLILCGAGPSLMDTAAEWCPKGDQIWGCNSAVTWLYDQGHKPTHGFTVDQTPHMVAEWRNPPPVEYLVASSCHPHLIQLLLGRGRSLRFFHNFVGIRQRPVSWADEDGVMQAASYEDWLYMTLYPMTVRAGSGLNSVNRAIDIALWMGFDKITLLGADCALRIRTPPPSADDHEAYRRWLDDTIMHADGGSATASGATAMTMGGLIDGRHWETKVDLVISAVWLVKAVKYLKGRLEIIGDVLPNALMGKSEEFLARLPRMVDSTGKAIPINLDDSSVYADL